jgi:hypothetical protein
MAIKQRAARKGGHWSRKLRQGAGGRGEILVGALLTALAAFLLRPLSRLQGCGPFFEEPVFVQTSVPDGPIGEFMAGKLGIIQPTYYRVYLYIAYRILSGQRFNGQEKQALEARWNPNLRSGWTREVTTADEQPDITRWLEERKKVPGMGEVHEIQVYRGGFWEQRGYVGYLNCPGDAFRNAAATLEKRIGQFGASHPEVLAWVRAQDQVLANCNGAGTLPKISQNWAPPSEQKPQTVEPGGNIPSPAPSDTPAVLRADRAYQIAAANFYAGNFDVAERLFRAIAEDSSSPWRAIAPYLVARTMVRKATLSLGPGEVDKAMLGQAEAQLDKLLGDPSLSAIHPAAASLRNLVRLKLYPEKRLHELAQALMKTSSGETLPQDVVDYTALLDRVSANVPATADAGDDLTDWIWTVQSGGDEAFKHAIGKWEHDKSLPWLVAVISKVPANAPQVAGILAAAEKTAPDSPAYLTVSFHIVRLLSDSGKKDEAREKLDALLARVNRQAQPSASNLFLAKRMTLARNLEELLRFAPREFGDLRYAGMDEEYGPNAGSNPRLKSIASERVAFDSDATKIFNEGMPLSLLKQAATSHLLSGRLRREVVVATWVRAFLLGDERTTPNLLALVEELSPELKSSLESYRTAKTNEDRQDAGVLMLLKFPGLRPYVMSGAGRWLPLDRLDNLRDNWWCPLTLGVDFELPNFLKVNRRPGGAAEQPQPPPQPTFAPFLSQAERDKTKEELDRLASLDSGPDFLGRRLMAWARRHPDDPRVPGALYTVVRLPHLGCPTTQTGEFSRAAFRLLHARYPNTPEAKKTKYWYR